MRSNDAAQASFMNAFAFIMLQRKVANELGLDVGSYTHRANSFHVYERNFDLLEQYVKDIKTQGIGDLTYDYTEECSEWMEESIPEIEEMIR